MTTPQTPIDLPTELAPALDPARELRAILRELRRQRVALIVLAVTIIAGGTIGYLDLRGKAADAALNRTALCALRGDLEARVDQGRDFLVKHPAGAFGFTPEAIQKSIADQERTIRALRPLPCPPPAA